VRVPEHLLDRDQVRTALEEVRCERVTQCMGADRLFDTRPLNVAAQDLPYAHPAQRCSPRIQEDAAFPSPSLQARTRLPEVDRERGDGTAADRYESLLVSLPAHHGDLLLQRQVPQSKPDHFRNAHPARVRELQEGPIPPGEWMREVGVFEKACHL